MKKHVYRLTITAVLAALALAFSFLEGFLPPLPIPGARLGLANLVVMYALAELSVGSAVGITAVKAVFALLRGPVACLMSTAGGAAALLAMMVFRKLLHRHFSFIGWGVVGAAAHNLGQLLMSVALLGSAMWYYTPLLLLMAIPAGAVTGLALNVSYPHLRQFSK
ncbi:MAG: Gx transporter family protein [Clostridia bacterium]|nr:Gx transporter family protein [Clostridia bacterium]